MNTRRNFLRGIALSPLTVVSAANTKTDQPVPKTIVVEKVVYKEMPENISSADAVVWLKVLEERRRRNKSGENFY